LLNTLIPNFAIQYLPLVITTTTSSNNNKPSTGGIQVEGVPNLLHQQQPQPPLLEGIEMGMEVFSEVIAALHRQVIMLLTSGFI
jgi:hypothetical protein